MRRAVCFPQRTEKRSPPVTPDRSRSRSQLSLGGRCSCLVEQTGARIIHTVLQGVFGQTEAEAFLKERDQFLKREPFEKGPVVEIRQLARHYRTRPGTALLLSGKKNRATREFLQPEHLIIQSVLFRPETLIGGKNPAIYRVRNQMEAEKLAVSLLNKSRSYTLECKHPEDSPYQALFMSGDLLERFSLLLPQVLYSEISGILSEQLIRERFQYERTLSARIIQAESPLYRIIRWRGDSVLGADTLRFFLNETFKISRSFPCRGLLHIADNPETARLLRNSLSLFPVESTLVQNLETAIQTIQQTQESTLELVTEEELPEPRTLRETNLRISATEIEELRDFIRLAHARETEIIQDHVNSLSPEHPLKGIYRTFADYAAQMDELKKGEIRNNALCRAEARKFRTLSLLSDYQSDKEQSEPDTGIMTLLRRELNLTLVSTLTVTHPLKDHSYRFGPTVTDGDSEDNLTGTLLPLLLGQFLAGREVSVFTPGIILTEGEIRDSALKPWIKAFLAKRKFTAAGLFRLRTIQDTEIWIYLERDHEPEDFPFSQFDPLVREIHQRLTTGVNRSNQNSGQSTSEPFSWDEIAEEFDNDRPFFLSLLKDFAALIPERKALIDKLIDEYGSGADTKELQELLHKIKGGASNLFCEDLRAAAEDFENAVRADCPAAWERNRDRLFEIMDQTVSAASRIPDDN